MIGKSTFNPRRKYPAAALALQVFIPSDMIGVGMGIVDCGQSPVIPFQNLAHLPACILVISAVNQAYSRLIQSENANLR